MGSSLIIPVVILICSPYSERLSRILVLALEFTVCHDMEAWTIKIDIDLSKKNKNAGVKKQMLQMTVAAGVKQSFKGSMQFGKMASNTKSRSPNNFRHYG